MVRKEDGSFELVASFCETTTVQFAEISEEIIEAYIETGEPLDKGD